MDLMTAARIAQDAVRAEVETAMQAHDRFAPSWEVQEIGMHFAIRNALLDHLRTLPEPRPRVANEYSVDAMTNLAAADPLSKHPADLTVLHPLIAAPSVVGRAGYAWSPENCTAMGVIEVKKEWQKSLWDASWLDEISTRETPAGFRPLEWVMFVVLLAGRTAEAVQQVARSTDELLAEHLPRVASLQPRRAPSHAGSAHVAEPWFDVMCYGKVAAPRPAERST